MTQSKSMRAIVFSALMLIQVLAPITYAAPSSGPDIVIETELDLDLLSTIGLTPTADIAHGWFNPDDGIGEINMLSRDIAVVAIDDWQEWTGQSSKLEGWYILTHEFPVPTEWFYELDDAGIDCLSFLPPNGFQCELSGHSPSELEELEVEGIVQLDPVDKIREDLVRSLTGVTPTIANPHASEGKAIVDMVLSGYTLPENVGQRTDVDIKSLSGRYSTAFVETSGVLWLAEQPEIEWIETRPYYTAVNTVAGTIIHSDDTQDSTKMSNADSSWSALDGSGIIVTVGDSGIDNGVNNSGMHPDFADHIKGILSWPKTFCTYTAPGVPGASCDDGADDDNGHGTHVAGSVLGDGTDSNGAIVGIAPEAQLLFHSWEQFGSFGAGIPLDIGDAFDLAVDNGSRIHTNSWRAPSNGQYNTGSAQADTGSFRNPNLVVMFAAGNEGTDGDGDGEIDHYSVGTPSTAKSIITIGASENYRPSSGSAADNISGMADFSSRGPTTDTRIKPEFVAPGTYILSTKSRSAGACGWGAHNSSYCYMGGTSMATPIAAGATALLLEHLIENRNHAEPSASLIKAIYGATSVDMMGQYSSATVGAGEAIPNNHEGWGRLDMWATMNATFAADESLSTNDDRGWSFLVPSAAPRLQLALAYNENASAVGASVNLINDLDLAIKKPDGTWTNLTDNINNLRTLTFDNPAQGTWEVHVIGTSVPSGPQFFSLALNAEYALVNLTQDADLDGTEDSSDDCAFTAGTSTVDRLGCVDTDGDGYSDPTSNWTIAHGADAFINEASQWRDQDGDGYGDNAAPAFEPDGCTTAIGTSTADRYGCPDPDFDTYSSPDGGWTTGSGADSCPSVLGTSSGDRNGCPDQDGDSYSDPDPSGTNGSVWLVSNGADAFVSDSTQWLDTDSDGYGDNPPPALNSDACPLALGTSTLDRLGCVDTDGDGYSDADTVWLAHPTGTADAFPNDPTQWLDTDGDGYGDNQSGNNPDACVNDGGSGIRSTIDRIGCPDSDEDGYSNADAGWPAHPIGTADAFPLDDTQWNDTDSDNYGDNAAGSNPDACVSVAGTSTSDRKGCPDSDGDTYSDPDPLGNNGSVWTAADGADVWPNEPTQWADTDGDGYGDNSNGVFPDSCVSDIGTSTADRYGCPDTDGDSYSDPDSGFTTDDGADFAPSDPLRWSDFDGDGYADQIDDACPLYWGNSTTDRNGCPDTDGDGTSDSDPNWTPVDNGSDAFKTDPTQSTDTDGDGFGDNASGNLADDCPNVFGDSWQNNTFGCVDSDQDGWADQEDHFINDPTQWADTDSDGFGDNLGGTTPDACIDVPGNSTLGNRMGCPDADGDGWDDVIDQLPNLANQWLDQDGDGYGDNATGPQPDACPGVAGTSTIDRFGCVDDDGDGMSNESDAFPNDPTRTQDTDGDGFDDLEDDCIEQAGNSSEDRTACPDTDGDGYSDPTLPIGNASGWNSSNGADALPLNPTQWNDSDGDGYGDNASGTLPDACPLEEGYSNVGTYGCPDGDNDGTPQSNDAFPDDPTQWSDIDGDGYGDNPNGTQPDNCTTVLGTSNLDVYGCPDADGDGASDTNDLWVSDSTQWFDSDGDGFGDNAEGTDGDFCPDVFGIADRGNAPGCIDTDGDGYADSDDVFPDEPTQWRDIDGDGYGDNQTSGASRPDHWVDDPTRNVAEADLTCTPENIQLDLAGEDYFSFSCTVVSALSDVTIRVEWQQVSSIIAATQIHVLTFSETTGLTQTVVFNGEGRINGNFQMYISIKEPGVEFAMASDTVDLVVFDSRIVNEEDLVSDQSSTLNNMLEMPIIQAMIGGLVLFFLMGMLIIRGNASKARLADERTEHAREIIAARLARLNNPQPPQLRQAFGVDGRVPPPPPPPRPPVP